MVLDVTAHVLCHSNKEVRRRLDRNACWNGPCCKKVRRRLDRNAVVDQRLCCCLFCGYFSSDLFFACLLVVEYCLLYAMMRLLLRAAGPYQWHQGRHGNTNATTRGSVGAYIPCGLTAARGDIGPAHQGHGGQEPKNRFTSSGSHAQALFQACLSGMT